MLRNFIIRLLINAVALAALIALLPDHYRIAGAETQQEQIRALLLIALIFGLVNAFIKPVLKFLTCPFIFFTFGLFLLVINGALFLLVARLSELLPGGVRLEVDGFLWAVIGAIIMSIVGMILEKALGLDEKVKVKTVREVHIIRERYRDDDAPMFPPPMPDNDPLYPPPEKPKRR